MNWNMAFSKLSLQDMEAINKVLLIHNFITYNAFGYNLIKEMEQFCLLAKELFSKLTLF